MGLCASETVIPLWTNAAASRTLSGVIRFAVPRSSSGPQRPAFDTSWKRASNSSALRGKFRSSWLSAPEQAAMMTVTTAATTADAVVHFSVMFLLLRCRGSGGHCSDPGHRSASQESVVKPPLHSSGDASRLNGVAPRTVAVRGLRQSAVGIWPICSLVAPCQASASSLSVLRGVSPRAPRACTSPCRKQSTWWSFTMPVACMCA